MKFEEMGLSKEILLSLNELGYENPMPIQELSIKAMLDGKKDIIGLAQTGTGKTAAYGLPLLQNTDVANRQPQALILSPTRELCMQIARDVALYGKYIEGLKVLPIYGGASIETQIRTLKRGVHIVVATPGRLLDLIRRKRVDISSIKYMVLDEADEMLSMGFKDELDSILEETPQEKRIYLYSATLPDGISDIAFRYMNEPEEIRAGSINRAAANVKHSYYKLAREQDRYAALKRIADNNPNIYGIVFCRTRIQTQEVADKLMQDGYSADALHGELGQKQRDYVMQKFRNNSIQILVATDVAARGLDVNDLTHVIHYELPDDPEVYIHRSGRTGRAGKEGISIALVGRRRLRSIRYFERQIGSKFVQKAVPTGKDICRIQMFHLVEQVKQVEVDAEELESYLPEILPMFEDLDRDELIKKFLSMEFNRFLSYYRDLPDLQIAGEGNVSRFDRDRGRGRDRDRGRDRSHRRNDQSSPSRYRSGSSIVTIKMGKKEGLQIKELIQKINTVSGSKRYPLGNIKLHKSTTDIEIAADMAEDLVKTLKKVRIDKEKLHPKVGDE